MVGEPFILGVNYWPRRKAMYWWQDFDPAEVADEFDVIAELGLDVVRIFLLWDDWQETPDSVSAERMKDFGVVADAAAARGLGLDVTFFTGHMSGPNWAPRWLLNRRATTHASDNVRRVISGGRIVDVPYRNMITDPVALDAERLLLSTVVGEFKDHPGIWMWNLGNEPDLFARPPDAATGTRWVREMTQLIKEVDPDHPVTTGLHSPDLQEDRGFRVDQVFSESDVAVIHGYPMYETWSMGGIDPDFIPYLCALTSALSGKPCLAEEWGGPTSPDTDETVAWQWTAYGQQHAQLMIGEQDLADYVEAVLPKLIEVGSTGSMLWCFADYVKELWDRPPCDEGGSKHERHFGLIRPDGSLKPHASVISDFASTNPLVAEATRTVDLDVTPDEYYQTPLAHAQRLYQEFLT